MKLGMVAGIVQAVLSLVCLVPFGLIGALSTALGAATQPTTANSANPLLAQTMGAGFMLVFCILAPFLYAILGFIFGALGALVYNLVAKFTGGVEFEFEHVS